MSTVVFDILIFLGLFLLMYILSLVEDYRIEVKKRNANRQEQHEADKLS